MGRKRDPKIQKFRERAFELKQAGLSPAEISQEEEFVEFGADAGTVRRWLREIRGPQPKARDEYRRLKAEGRSRVEIVEELGISEAYSWELDREIEGPKRVVPKKHLPTFLDDPKKHRFAPWAVTNSFIWELNGHVVAMVDDKPALESTAQTVRYAVEQLEALLEVRRGKEARWTRCQLVQAKANEAARLRSTEEPKGALLVLEHCRDLSRGCLACKADLDRRSTLVLRDQARYEEALNFVRRSRAYYLETDGIGHDPHKDGIGNCGLAEANLYLHQELFELAERTAEESLPGVKRGGVLYHFLLAVICVANVQRTGSAARAHRIVDEQLENYFREPGLNRVKLWCLKARLFETDRDVAEAIALLENALSDVEDYVKIPAAAAFVIGELERLSGGTLSQGLSIRIEDLGEVEEAEAEGESESVPLKWTPPDWLGSAFEAFDRARVLWWEGAAEEALAVLRAEGRAFMPALA